MTLQTKVELFTPERARAILGAHQNVRRLNRRDVKFLAGQMSDGRWADNGETVKFNSSGQMVDGQHRMAAIVESGVSVNLLCVYGATEVGVDEGRRRVFGDLFVGGKQFGLLQSAIVRCLHHIGNGDDPWQKGVRGSMSNQEMDMAYRSLDHDRFASAVGLAIESKKTVTGSVAGVISYLASENGAMGMVNGFFGRVCSGAMLNPDSPELHLKSWLASTKAKKGRDNSVWTRAKFVVCARAWNAHVMGVDVYGPSLWTKVHDTALPVVSAPNTMQVWS